MDGTLRNMAIALARFTMGRSSRGDNLDIPHTTGTYRHRFTLRACPPPAHYNRRNIPPLRLHHHYTVSGG